jgi:hypothetical protein
MLLWMLATHGILYAFILKKFVLIPYSSNTLTIEPDLSPTRIEGDGAAVHVASVIGNISQTPLSVSDEKCGLDGVEDEPCLVHCECRWGLAT